MTSWLDSLVKAASRAEQGLRRNLRLPLGLTWGKVWAMLVAQLDFRQPNLASNSVARAFVLSLLFHLLLFLTIELGHETGLWNTTLLFADRQAKLDDETVRLMTELKKREQAQDVPLVFVDVDPSQVSEEAPKDSQFYSALNSRAANPEPPKVETNVPKIDGQQEKVPRTMDKARPAPQPLQPEPAPAPQPEIVEVKPEPKPIVAAPDPPAPAVKEKRGDLAFAKPVEKPREATETKPTPPVEKPKPPRPRTLAAMAQEKGGMAGQKMKQQGGVKRLGVASSLDVRSTPFGTYDAAIIAAIQQHWYDLLDRREFTGNYSGKVVLEFRLNSNGRVSDMHVSEADVTEVLSLLCQRAVQEPAPFPAWPDDLKRLVGKDYRDVRFTFYYN